MRDDLTPPPGDNVIPEPRWNRVKSPSLVVDCTESEICALPIDLSKDQIILDLTQINMSNVQFPYYDTQNKLSIIGIYRKLYGNPTFRTIMKAQSPPLCFEYDDINSDPDNGIYIFVLIDCEPEDEKEEKKETKKSDDEFIKGEIAALRKEKLADKDLYKKGKISKKEYNKREKKIEREISEYKDQLKNT